MYGNRSTLALTCEIYTNSSAWQYEPGPLPNSWWRKGVFQFFNSNPDSIETVIKRWLPVFTYITNRAITEAYDIATINIASAKTVVGQGFLTKIDVTVVNWGDFSEAFDVTVYANETSIAFQTITLVSGGSTIVTFTWDTTNFAYGNYTLSAYATPIPGETDTADNESTFQATVALTIPGDVNGDRVVGISDAAMLSVHYGHSEPWPHPDTDPNVDINGDGVVSLKDAVILCARMNGKPFRIVFLLMVSLLASSLFMVSTYAHSVNTMLEGLYPAVYGNIIAFSRPSDDHLVYYDIVTMFLTDTGHVGAFPSIYGNIIAFLGGVPIEIVYYDISAGILGGTGATGDIFMVADYMMDAATPLYL
jgi:hypothetical protein